MATERQILTALNTGYWPVAVPWGMLETYTPSTVAFSLGVGITRLPLNCTISYVPAAGGPAVPAPGG
jgi:hypothetical protein